MKPDKPGIWYSRDGQTARVWAENGILRCKLIYSSGWETGVIFTLQDLPDDDWLPAEPPEFPELPPKPLLCYTTHRRFGGADWRVVLGEVANTDPEPEAYEVIPHPDNDPEAVALIEQANRS